VANGQQKTLTSWGQGFQSSDLLASFLRGRKPVGQITTSAQTIVSSPAGSRKIE
jgi:hypothetical protein